MTDADEDRTIAEIRAYQRGRLIRSTPVRRAMSDHIEHECPECFSLLCPSTRCLKKSRVVEPDYQARAEQAKRDEEKKRAAVVADSPELAQARSALDEMEDEHGRLAVDVFNAEADRDAARAELAQARERIAALEADVVDLIGERDAALARVRELDHALAHAHLAIEGLKAAAQPKPRDDAPAPATVRPRRSSKILRDEAGILRRVSVDDPDYADRCRVAAGYDSAAALLDLYEAEDDYASKNSPAPAADPEDAPPEATP